RQDRAEDRRALEREPSLRQRAADRRQEGECLREPDRPAQDRHPNLCDRGKRRLTARGDAESARLVPDGAPPGRRSVHENPVLECHPTEPDLLFIHAQSVATRLGRTTTRARNRAREAPPATGPRRGLWAARRRRAPLSASPREPRTS